MRQFDHKIVLEDGSEYPGFSFGSREDRVCEIVFNTSMAGYQEIVSDLSYTDQMVVMTYPLIGNYGICEEDYECKIPSIGALVVYDYNDNPPISAASRRCPSCWRRTIKPPCESQEAPGAPSGNHW